MERTDSMDELLKNTNDMRKILMESVGSGIFAYTLPDREILALNPEAKRLFDCPEDSDDYDFIAMINNKILPEDSINMRMVTAELKNPGDCAEYVFHIQKDSGEQLTVKCNSKLRSFSNGQRYILSAMTDVTDQDDERTRSILGSLSSIYHSVYYCDLRERKCEVIKMQESADDRLRYDGTVEDFIRVYASEYIVEEFEREVLLFLDPETFDARFRDTDVLTIEYRRKKIGWCRGMLIVTERGEDGGVASLVFAVRNIDAQKKRELQTTHETEMALRQAFESARSANNAKTRFFANMSHDMRTPLNVIVGMTAVASAHADDPGRVRDCLNKIEISGKHLLRLINEVLDMSKIEAGQMELREEEFSLREMFDELLVLTRSQVENKGHEFLVSFQNIEHDKVLGDSQRLQQVFLNILSNSVKYTPPGGTITISVREMPAIEDKLSQYEFIIEDNGIGMSEEFMAHLFEPFERAVDSRVDHTQGTGLGMPIAQNIIQMMNGTISVDSKLDQGTKFTILLRLKVQESERDALLGASDGEDGAEETQPQFSPDIGKGRRLLVAEDYDMNWEVLEMLLPDYGYELERAEDGQICVDKFNAYDPGYYDAILMDVRMPVKNGIAATVEIRRSGREDADLPIIAMTADAFVEDVQACKDAGMDEHVSKPLDIRKLLEILDQYLA